MVLVLTVVVLQSISFSNYALTIKTTNIIHGSAPYLTFDGGRTRVTNTDGLLGITLSNGSRFTPATNISSATNPIELPYGDNFADIGMFVPTNVDSIDLNLLIRAPYNYWGDDDGDGQGTDGIWANGHLTLSIVDNNGQAVARSASLDICKAPYRLTLSNSKGALATRYGIPNESRFEPRTATYYINTKETTPTICFARPQSRYGDALSAAIWKHSKGFLPQSFTPSSYGSNFPTTGANNLYFYLDIRGNNQALSWAPVSHGGITATMTDSTSTSVRVTLTGPAVTDRSQWESENPRRIDRISLPQVFELVGRDSRGNAVVKYGFELKQWFVNRGTYWYEYYSVSGADVSSWCNKIGGYRLPNVRDITNASCRANNDNPEDACNGLVEATPTSPDKILRRYIGAGFFTEWGTMYNYTGANFAYLSYWTQDRVEDNNQNFVVNANVGVVSLNYSANNNIDRAAVLCVYP